MADRKRRICDKIAQLRDDQVLPPAPSPLSVDNRMVFQVFESYLYGATDSSIFRQDLQTLLTYLKTTQNMDIWLVGSTADFYVQPTSPFIGDLNFFCQRRDSVGKFKDGYNNYSHGRELVYERGYSQIDFILDEDRYVRCTDTEKNAIQNWNIWFSPF